MKSEFEEISSCGASALFSLQVLDDSMEPEFPRQCIIIIDPSGIAKNGAYILAENPDEGYIFRQLFSQENQHCLRPLNTSYPEIEIPDLKIIKGIIVQRAGKHKTDRKHY